MMILLEFLLMAMQFYAQTKHLNMSWRCLTMIDLSTVDHIYLYPGSTDLRKGRVTLRYLAKEIAKDDEQHKLFLFCNRSNKLIKIYEKDATGVWVYIRSLDESRFGWPNNIEEAKEINKSQIEWLLRGLKFISFDSQKNKKRASF